jgi:hypothetical protein
MFFSLILFTLFGTALGALVGAAGFGGEGLLLGGSVGLVAAVACWILLWVSYQRLGPSVLTADEEYRNQPQPARQVVRNQ